MLRNRMYLGELNHRQSNYPGEHRPIVDRDLFEAVQAKLTGNLHQRRAGRSNSEALLMGRLYDDRGNRMSPTYRSGPKPAPICCMASPEVAAGSTRS